MDDLSQHNKNLNNRNNSNNLINNINESTTVELDSSFFESMSKSSKYYNKDELYKFKNDCFKEKNSLEKCLKDHPGLFCDKLSKLFEMCLNK
jgi:hypothetical protein